MLNDHGLEDYGSPYLYSDRHFIENHIICHVEIKCIFSLLTQFTYSNYKKTKVFQESLPNKSQKILEFDFHKSFRPRLNSI